MEMLIKFIEDQLDLATKHGDSFRLVNGFKLNAYGAVAYTSYCAVLKGDYGLSQKIDILWESKYRVHFEMLERTAEH